MATVMTAADALAWAFARPRTAKLGIVTPSGAPLVAPIWVGLDGDQLLFNTGAETAKGRAIACDPRVSLCFDDDTPPFSFVIVAGTAEIIDDLAEVRRWAAIIGGRYMGEDQAEAFGDRNGVPGELLVRVTPTKITGSLGLAD